MLMLVMLAIQGLIRHILKRNPIGSFQSEMVTFMLFVIISPCPTKISSMDSMKI